MSSLLRPRLLTLTLFQAPRHLSHTHTHTYTHTMDLNTTVEVVSSSPTSPTSTSTSLLHTLPSLITTSLLSHLSPHLVPPTANPLAVTASISPTQSAHFFVHDVKVRGTTKRNVEFHILLTVNHAVREEPTECDTSDATVNSDTTSPPKHRGTLKRQAKTVKFPNPSPHHNSPHNPPHHPRILPHRTRRHITPRVCCGCHGGVESDAGKC